MIKIQYLLRNRNIILILSLATGLIWGKGTQWTETTTLPALAIVMTLSVMGITKVLSGLKRQPFQLLLS